MLTRILFFFSLISIIAIHYAHADINVSPLWVNFGYTRVGSFQSQTVWVSNRFNEAIQVTTTSNCFGDIQVQNGCYGYLSGYGSCTIQVQYRPMSTGSDSCSIDVRDSTSDWKSVGVNGSAGN
jgi:hypothetical protein